jgi:hypothetical protein
LQGGRVFTLVGKRLGSTAERPCEATSDQAYEREKQATD